MDNHIQHYGILGMKWGIRRTEAQLARARGSKKSSETDDDKTKSAKASSAPKKKSVSEMTDDEIRNEISRIKLEKEYKSLTQPADKATSNKGKDFVESVLTNSAKNIATQAVTYAMGASVNKIAKSFGIENMVNPKKGQKDK